MIIPEENQIVMVSLEQIVPKEHFLRRLKELFPWDKWAEPFEKIFKGEKEYGPKGYPVVVLLRMTILSFLYNMSDPQTERLAKESNPAKYFLGLSLLQPVPDETTLCRFRNRIIEKKRGYLIENIFKRVLEQAPKLGIEMGKVQIFDGVHTNSKINAAKEEAKNRRLENKGEKPKPPIDSGASWGCKGKIRVKDPQTGEVKEHKKFFYGYKSHISLNQKTNLVTSVITSTGLEPDVNYGCPLLEADHAKGLKTTVATGDKGYDDIGIFLTCAKYEIFPAMRIKKNRIEQKNQKNAQYWLEHTKQPFYQKALAIRYKIEQKFGEGKNRHGLGTCRYLGLAKFNFQALFTFMAMNLKKILKLVPKSRMQPCYS